MHPAAVLKGCELRSTHGALDAATERGARPRRALAARGLRPGRRRRSGQRFPRRRAARGRRARARGGRPVTMLARSRLSPDRQAQRPQPVVPVRARPRRPDRGRERRRRRGRAVLGRRGARHRAHGGARCARTSSSSTRRASSSAGRRTGPLQRPSGSGLTTWLAQLLRAELLARRPGQLADDEVVRVLDQVAQKPVAEAAVDGDRVPVTLVEVVAGTDGGVGRRGGRPRSPART